MTVEVAIVNRQAVALAADSAVTVQGTSGQKVYNSVNKVFALSKYHPVGLMAYSSAEIMGTPIETAVKVFRRLTHNDDPCKHLEGYCDRFQEFLKTKDKLFRQDARLTHCFSIINQHFDDLRADIIQSVTLEHPGICGPSKTQLRIKARLLLDANCERYRQSADLINVTASARRLLKTEIRAFIVEWQDIFCRELNLTKGDVNQLLDLGVNLILKQEPSGSETGIVIAGFGEDDYFPQVISFEFECSIYDIHKIRSMKRIDLASDPPDILPFAQTDVIDALYKGRDPGFDNSMNEFLVTEFNTMRSNATGANLSPAVLSQVLANIDALSRQFTDHLKDYLDNTTKNYTEPLQQTIAVMPKEELAMMADALVNITSMHRKMSPGSETVGGPTDVAVISKGDGFVWIKRKHYFDPKYNPPFFANYFRS